MTRLRLVALLLSAAAGGFLVGRLTAPEWGGRGGERRAAPAPEEPRAPPTVPVAAVEAPGEPLSTTRAVVQPSGPAWDPAERPAGPPEGVDAAEEEGVLELDFEGWGGARVARIGWRTLRGGHDETVAAADEEALMEEVTLPTGVYVVWWHDPDGRRTGTRAAVEAGRRTRVRLADHRERAPIPEGLGLLEVEVAATWGGGLGWGVTVGRGLHEDEIDTDETGYGSAALLPGRYSLAIGDDRAEVAVAEGRVTSCRIAHDKEGDILFDGEGRPGQIALSRPGQPFEMAPLWTGEVNGEPRSGLIYIREGEWNLFFVRDGRDRLGVPLGRALVQAGRTTVFRYSLPTGGVHAVVRRPDGSTSSWIEVRRVVDGRASEERMTLYRRGLEERFRIVLAPGRYSVEANATYCEPQAAEIEVGDSMVELAFDLVQSR